MTTDQQLTEPVELFNDEARRPLPAVDLDQYRRDGFAVMENFLSQEELDVLRAETTRICRGELGELVHKGGSGVDAGPEDMADMDVVRQFLCIHFPHKLSATMLGLISHPLAVASLVEIIGPDVKAMQSMMFVKSEGKPGQAWHQDEYFIPTRDRSLTAIWMALDDATVNNGCLWVLPGSHQPGVIYPERVIDDDRFDCTTEAYRFPYRDEDSVPVEMAAGSAVVFNGYLLHRSMPNKAPGSLRRAVVNHYMSAQSLLPWRPPRDGEHMAMVDDRDVIIVAGTDPYAWKGFEQRHRAYVRPDREGGCER
ncbi:MAG TPA: phytanoyl-CoA dioxygenase family protein [Acidimicrobiales bacterium]|nr:phytanoyl-CoA dioxygenase family protein [Acidimicrobiales bacterium]